MQTHVNTAIFKSYDVRGIYPSELNEDIAYQIGRCFVALLGAKTDGRRPRYAAFG